jgi:NAD(P)-dependent dehydrogenase (short-subunit alcohol dehydrogenase family)
MALISSRLNNKVALVTGAARGIGRAIARRLAEEGAKVIITADKDEKGLHLLQDELMKARPGYEGFYLLMDVTKKNDVEAGVANIIERLNQIDILVNNAGINTFQPLLDMPEEEWDKVINVNLKGVFIVTQAVAREMVRRKSGKIINLSSALGKKGVKYYAHYSASKAGVIAFTQSTSAEMAKFGINVNAVCPGEVETEMLWTSYERISQYEHITLEDQREKGQNLMVLRRFEHPEDIAPLVAFLASDESNYITGQSINVCGGIHFH